MPNLTNRTDLLWLKKCVLENLWKDTESLITVIASGEGNGCLEDRGGTEDLFTL